MTRTEAESDEQAAELSDAAIVLRSRHDPDAFARIFDRHAATLHRFLARRVGAQLADDLTGQTMLVAFDQRDRFDAARSSALPWLYGIATNLIGRHRRVEIRQYRAYARTGLDAAAPGHDELVSTRVSAEQAGRLLVKGVAKLPAPERDVLLLIAWEYLSYDEVAAALDVPIGTVRSRLHRARNKMRAVLGVDPLANEEE